MRPWMMLVGTAALVAGSLDAQQRNAVFSARVQEWVVPWKDSRPRDPYADRQGRVWFVGQAGNMDGIMKLSPTPLKVTC